jgi:hypothetical protein
VEATVDVVEDQLGDLLPVPRGKQRVLECGNYFDPQSIPPLSAMNSPDPGLQERLNLLRATDQEHVGAGLNQISEARPRSIPAGLDNSP